MNRVIHFDIQADDIDKAKKFYHKVLGWKFNHVMKKEEGMMDYWMIETGDGIGINGGLSRRPKEEGRFLFDCTVEVEDIEKTLQDIKDNGGEILMKKTEIPNVGIFARVEDPTGNVFGLMQPTGSQR